MPLYVLGYVTRKRRSIINYSVRSVSFRDNYTYLLIVYSKASEFSSSKLHYATQTKKKKNNATSSWINEMQNSQEKITRVNNANVYNTYFRITLSHRHFVFRQTWFNRGFIIVVNKNDLSQFLTVFGIQTRESGYLRAISILRHAI